MSQYFKKDVDLTSREAMVSFLRKHKRYYTMHSWNKSASYAHNVKLYNLGLTKEQLETAFSLLDIEEVSDRINEMLWEWGEAQEFVFQAGFNGRSSGYIVLYSGGEKDGRVFTRPGQDLDFAAEEEELSFEELVDKVQVVISFDELCDKVRDMFIDMCDNCVVETKVVHVPKQVKVLVCNKIKGEGDD